MGNVTVIPATKELHSKMPTGTQDRRKVAAYARVSTDKEEQENSFDAQVEYYTNKIKANPEWEFAGVYSDEGISGTSTKQRDGFNRMLTDALAGEIDLIVTKSVSRFARNTVDSLSTIRRLKENGCEVYFEKENIWTFDSKGELLITIMSSLAQEESRSISENVTWGQRKRFADGKVNMPYSSFLGYRKGENGEPVIVPEEAKTVRLIYRLFMEGKSLHAITKILMQKGIPTPRGKTVWQTSTLESILTNEKYKGDALLQKKFTVDFLSKTMKLNEGEVPQYYVTDSHPAIIGREEWTMVQAEMLKRKSKGKHHNSMTPFSGKIFCGDCGLIYGSKVWHSTDKYRRVVWQCNGKYAGEHKCETTHLTEDEIKEIFMKAVRILLSENKALVEDCELMIATLTDTADADKECDALEEEMKLLSIRIERLIEENSAKAMNQAEYREKYDYYESQFDKANRRIKEIWEQMKKRSAEAEEFKRFLKAIRSGTDNTLTFTDELWNATVEKVTVYRDDRLVFTFKNGREIEEIL